MKLLFFIFELSAQFFPLMDKTIKKKVSLSWNGIHKQIGRSSDRKKMNTLAWNCK